MALDAAQGGKAIEQKAPELLRIWRLVRATARPQVFPGLLDGVMGDFLARAGKMLAAGEGPEEVWRGLTGVIRLSPALGTKELTGEWAVAMEVLSAACESLDTEPEVGEWLARAVAEVERGTTAMVKDPYLAKPDGVVAIVIHGELRMARKGAPEDP